MRRYWGNGGVALLATLALVFISSTLPAQGILTLTPGRSITSTAGTGNIGYTGDNGLATSAALASPSSVAYDAAGDLFLADTLNHVIREVSVNGTITTVAGSGVQGFSGDNGSATSAQLDTPTGVTVDPAGNLYIADSHNHRIRKVSAGTISTLAGTGIPSFSGDGGPATLATLSLPSAVAVDATGNLYIADTNNQRIRKVAGTSISTVAGNGEELFQGDGSSATSASLSSPIGIAVDRAGNLYIADRHNQRIRMVNAAGDISTLAGSGAATFSGSFSGDGESSTSSTLARPSGVSVAGIGAVYIADTGNQRIRQVFSGGITTLTGNGEQGFGGDSGLFDSGILSAPRAVATDATGNISIADRLNQRIRSGAQPVLTFPATAVGSISPAQTVTLTNTGNAPLTIPALSYTGTFAAISGGTCSAIPITLTPGASCTESVAFAPTSANPASGSLSIASQTIRLVGSGTPAATQITLTSNTPTPFVGQPVTLTAAVTGNPTGTVTFSTPTAPLGTAALSSGSATLTTTFAAAGTYSITAVYSGDANHSASTSLNLSQLVGDFNFTVLPDPTLGSDFSLTVAPGGSGTYNLTVQPLDGPFTFPISLTATGLPPGATATFTPQTVTLGPSAVSFKMTIQTAKTSAAFERAGTVGMGFALLLLPFAGKVRRMSRKIRPLTLALFFMGYIATLGGITGCGSGSGLSVQSPQAYTINIVATAQGSNGATLQHVASVKLIVQ